MQKTQGIDEKSLFLTEQMVQNKFVKQLKQGQAEWMDVIEQSLSSQAKPMFWNAWNDNRGTKIKHPMICSFSVPGHELFFGEVQVFFQIESVGYVIIKYGKERGQIDALMCPVIELLQGLEVLPLFHYNRVEQGWTQENGTIIINKYAHY
jgi:hypothetical protein